MTEQETDEEFLGMGVDLTTDTFTDEEKAATLEWYRRVHDHGDLDLAPFSRFMLEHDQAGFKRLRRHLLATDEESGEPPFPIAVGVLMWVHTYIVLGIGKSALYEIIAMRELGVTRTEIMETVRWAAVNGGPRGINPLAEWADDYLREWSEDPATPSRIQWPDGWAPDLAQFRSGIDLTSDRLEPGELELLRAWYLRLYGEVPAHVDFLARVTPAMFKTQRARFEKALSGALPAQMIPLMLLHLSAVRGWPKPLRRSLQMARTLGVTRHQAVMALYWAAVYGGDIVMETAMDAGGDILESWESAPRPA